jgi:hypothetical protein
MGEIQNAARAPVPHLYGSTDVHRDQPWSEAASQAFQKSRSNVAQLKLRGIALWLAIVYHETRDIPHEGLSGVHREILGEVLVATHQIDQYADLRTAVDVLRHPTRRSDARDEDELLLVPQRSKKRGGLVMTSREALLKGGAGGAVLTLGKPEDSPLIPVPH